MTGSTPPALKALHTAPDLLTESIWLTLQITHECRVRSGEVDALKVSQCIAHILYRHPIRVHSLEARFVNRILFQNGPHRLQGVRHFHNISDWFQRLVLQ